MLLAHILTHFLLSDCSFCQVKNQKPKHEQTYTSPAIQTNIQVNPYLLSIENWTNASIVWSQQGKLGDLYIHLSESYIKYIEVTSSNKHTIVNQWCTAGVMNY